MYILTTLLRFTVLAVIVLSVLQLGVFTLFPDRYSYNLLAEYDDVDERIREVPIPAAGEKADWAGSAWTNSGKDSS